jgi:hypothetical protein
MRTFTAAAAAATAALSTITTGTALAAEIENETEVRTHEIGDVMDRTGGTAIGTALAQAASRTGS